MLYHSLQYLNKILLNNIFNVYYRCPFCIISLILIYCRPVYLLVFPHVFLLFTYIILCNTYSAIVTCLLKATWLDFTRFFSRFLTVILRMWHASHVDHVIAIANEQACWPVTDRTTSEWDNIESSRVGTRQCCRPTVRRLGRSFIITFWSRSRSDEHSTEPKLPRDIGRLRDAWSWSNGSVS